MPKTSKKYKKSKIKGDRMFKEASKPINMPSISIKSPY